MLSYKIKRLLIISLGIVILALAAQEGVKDTPSAPQKIHTPYPLVPSDIDPNVIDPDIVNRSSVAESVPVYLAKPAISARPLISAEAYMVANLQTGEIYNSFNPNKIFPIASLSKLMTAIIASHNMASDEPIQITQKALDDGYGDAGHFTLGETLTVSEMLYPLLLESSNDAAEALAQSYGYDKFIASMNALASELNMKSTSFKDASGLSPGNISSATDLFILARYLYTKEQSILEITRLPVKTVATTTEHGLHIWHSTNPFPFDPHFLGGKTGRTTEAKESMVSLLRYTQGQTSYPVAVIVLRSDFSLRELDSSILFTKFMQKLERR